MLSRLRSMFRRPPPPTVEVTAAGFVLLDAAGSRMTVEWEQVRRVVAYKRDLLTTDCIVLAFESETAAGVLEVSEDWSGFSGLFGAMETALGVSPQWYLEIMSPSFEPTPHLLYERPASLSSPGEPA